MSKLQELVDAITAYEEKQLADEWSISYYRAGYEKLTFDKLIKTYSGDSYDWVEINHRVDNYFTFGLKYDCEDWDSQLDRLTQLYEAFQILDAEFNEDWTERYFLGETPSDVITRWKREEEWEKEEEARQEAREFCANFIFNDGMVDTIDEAYELFDMACGR